MSQPESTCKGDKMNDTSVIVATPNSLLRNRLASIVDKTPNFKVIARTADLMNTYNEVEERLPRAVLIADVLARLPEFEVMRALFSALDIRWLIVTTSSAAGRSATRADTAPLKRSDLFAVAADAPENEIINQLRSLTRTPVSIRPAIRAAAPSPSPKPVNVRAAETTLRSAASLQRPSTTANQMRQAKTSSAPPLRSTAPPNRLVLIGASTGGVDALLSVLASFSANCPPTLIVQHTGSGFGESLVGLLNRQCQAHVQLASGTTALRPGLILVGAGTKQHLVLENAKSWRAGLSGDAAISGHLPSVDALFQSAVSMAGKVTAALLTGMGRDGANGLKALRDAGAFTIAQNEATSVVYGMPRAAAELDAADLVLPLDDIGPALLKTTAGQVTPRRELTK